MNDGIEDIVAMARAAYRDDRLADGALYGKLADEIECLRARVAVLEAALKPFAALPLWPDAAGDLASEFIESETDLAPVARNDIRAARAALEAQP
jgi:hypothetical protein